MSLTLYAHPFAAYCWKVLIALYENETPSPIVSLRMRPGGPNSNPYGRSRSFHSSETGLN